MDDGANRVAVGRLRAQSGIALGDRGLTDVGLIVGIDDGARYTLCQTERPDGSAVGARAQGRAHIARIAGRWRRTDVRDDATRGLEELRDVRCAHGLLISAADEQRLNQAPVQTELVRRHPAAGVVVGIAISAVEVQRPRQEFVRQQRDQHFGCNLAHADRAPAWAAPRPRRRCRRPVSPDQASRVFVSTHAATQCELHVAGRGVPDGPGRVQRDLILCDVGASSPFGARCRQRSWRMRAAVRRRCSRPRKDSLLRQARSTVAGAPRC